jgi:hypothetical protein
MEFIENIDDWRRQFWRCWHRPSWWMLLITSPWLIGAAICLHEWRTDRTIALRQQTTFGMILTHEPANHDRYGYAFSINGKSYRGWHTPYGSDQPAVGQAVTVYYDPLNPNTSALVDYGELALRRLGPVPFTLGGSGLFALLILAIRRTSSPPSSSECTRGGPTTG